MISSLILGIILVIAIGSSPIGRLWMEKIRFRVALKKLTKLAEVNWYAAAEVHYFKQYELSIIEGSDVYDYNILTRAIDEIIRAPKILVVV